MTKSNKYGYKVCYMLDGSSELVRRFKAYTYEQALDMVRILKRSIQARWYIIPITKSEVRDGIWREIPF